MAVQQITPSILRQRYGATERFWERRRPAMVRAGLLKKVGRYFFGDFDRIDAAIADGVLSEDSEAAAQ